MVYSISLKVYELSQKLLNLKKKKTPRKCKNYVKNLFNIPFSNKILLLLVPGVQLVYHCNENG